MSQVMQHCYCLSSEKFTITESLIAGKEETTIIFCKYRRSEEALQQAFPNVKLLLLPNLLTDSICNFIIKLFILIKRLIILSVINQKGGFTELGKHKTATIMI